jgi:uncharacterized protein (DUF1697 family)
MKSRQTGGPKQRTLYLWTEGKVDAMAVFVALLRAVNVGGTGLLPMKELAALCVDLGFESVRTYIQSGNVVFESPLLEQEVKSNLERVLAEKMGKRVDAMVRSAEELRATLAANPFLNALPARVGVLFLVEAPPPDILDRFVIPGPEELRLVNREIFIHYPDGMGQSKLKLPTKVLGTMRNLNTVAKLVAMTTA